MGKHVFVVDYWRGLRVFDIANPAAPALVVRLDLGSEGVQREGGGFSSQSAEPPALFLATAIHVSGDLGFLGGDEGMVVVDVSDVVVGFLGGFLVGPSSNEILQS